MPRSIRRRWPLALPLSLGLIAAAAVGGTLWMVLPPAKTQVASMLHVDAKPRSISSEGGAGVNLTELEMYQKTQVVMARSRLTLNAALRDPKVANLSIVRSQADILDWLEKNLKIDFDKSPEIMTISLEGREPEQLVPLVNAITKVYLDEVVHRERKQTKELRDQIGDFLDRYEDRLKRTRSAMRRLKEGVGAIDNDALALRRQAAQLEFNLASQDLSRIRSEVRQVKSELTAFESKDGTPFLVSESEIQALIDKDTLLCKYTERLAQTEEAIEDMGKSPAQGDRDPAVQKQLREQEKLKQRILRRRQELQRRLEEDFRERAKLNAREQHARLKQRLEMLTDLEKQTSGEVTRMANEAKGIVKGGLDIEDNTYDIAHLEEICKSMRARKEKLTMDLDAPDRVVPLQDATIYPGNELLWRGGISGGAAAGVLFGVLLLVAFLELRSRRIASATMRP